MSAMLTLGARHSEVHHRKSHTMKAFHQQTREIGSRGPDHYPECSRLWESFAQSIVFRPRSAANFAE